MKSKHEESDSLNHEKELQKIAERLKYLRKKQGYTNMDIFAYEHDTKEARTCDTRLSSGWPIASV